MTVNVSAPAWSFPADTDLIISAIEDSDLDWVENKLAAADVENISTVIAYDIKFIYDWIEAQPLNWKTVQVSFGYSGSNELLQAESDDSQSLEVYQLDDKDWKLWDDVKWNVKKLAIEKVLWEDDGDEEVVVKPMKIVENNEWEVVINAKSFSIYAVVTVEQDLEPIQVTYYLNGWHWTEDGNSSPEEVTYTKSGSWDYIADKYFKTPSKDGYMFMWWFDQSLTTRWTWNLSGDKSVYAKWQEFEDLDIYIINGWQSAHYTMMDRNLWATERFNQKYDKQNFGSFWYHFQWWNNYGFKPCNWNNCSSFDEGENVSSWELDNTLRSNVSSSKFYYWVWNNNGDMRWSWNNVSNLWWSQTNTLGSRQWPCPDEYHIPNDSEWEEVINKSKNIGISVVNISVALLLSQPGYRNADGKWISFPHTFWSSDASYSMDNKKIKTSFMMFESWQFDFKKDQGVDSGRSIRCFKNVVTNSFDLSHIDEDWWLRGEISISSWTVLYLKNPVKQWYIFGWWYKNSGFLWEKIELWSYISSTDYLYAKWSPCPDWFVADDESINCLPESIAYASNQKISQIVEDLEVFMINNNETFHYTLMDRNMWAKERYDWNIENQNSYWYVYQWWNNYWFPSTWSLVDHWIASYNFQVPYSDWIIYSPSNFSKNVWSTFNSNNGRGVWWIEDAGLDDSKVLWQWDWTAESRQWPCPNGYYVPHEDIFQSFINQWKASDPKFSYKSFASDFLFPIVWYRKIDWTLQAGIWRYWTSTPHNSNWNAYTFSLNSLSFEWGQNYDYGYSVRCFKKEVNTWSNTFDISHIQLSWWSNVVLSMLSSWEIVGLTNPILEDHAFQWWYKDEDFTPWTEVNVWDVLLTWDYLYAKWWECDEWEIQTSHGCQITAEWQKNQQIVSDLDVYILWSDSNKEHYTLMDRNMWAIDIYDKNYDSPNSGSLWYYYQWWNNYWFDTYLDNDWKLLYTDNKRVDVLSGAWDEPYDSYIFIKSRNWMKQAIPNKRWWDDTILSHRQWPCPDSYHIPGADEWSTVISWWDAVRNSSKTEGFTNVFLLPPAWYRDRGSDNSKFSTVLNKWLFIRYTTSSWVDGVEPKEDGNAKYRPVYAVIADKKTDLPKLTDTQYERTSNALSIRCFKNEVNSKTSAIDTADIYLDGWENAIISILSSWEVINLQNPTRASSNFSWWYTHGIFMRFSRSMINCWTMK